MKLDSVWKSCENNFTFAFCFTTVKSRWSIKSVKVYSQCAIAIDAPLKWIQCTSMDTSQCTSMDLFTVSDSGCDSDCDSDCDIAITKLQMGIAPKFSD